MGDPYYLAGLLAAPVLLAALGWLARRYVVVRRILAGVTEAIHDRKDAAVGEKTGEHALALRSLTTRIAAEMLERGLTKAFDKHLDAAGHNPAGSPLRDVLRRLSEPAKQLEPLGDLDETMAGPDTKA